MYKPIGVPEQDARTNYHLCYLKQSCFCPGKKYATGYAASHRGKGGVGSRGTRRIRGLAVSVSRLFANLRVGTATVPPKVFQSVNMPAKYSRVMVLSGTRIKVLVSHVQPSENFPSILPSFSTTVLLNLVFYMLFE